jgi:acyl carrier protein
VLEQLPLNANGKLDRKALPAPDATEALREQYVAPRTPVEEVLAGIWCDVLGVQQVGVEDNFFALGGHSLLAMRMIARVRETFAVEVPLRVLFEGAETVRELARQVEQGQRDEQGLPLPQLLPRSQGEKRLLLSLAQERLWFLEQLESLGSAYHLTMTMQLDGELDVPALEFSFVELVRRHESLRTHFESVEGQGYQVIDSAEDFRVHHAEVDEGELRQFLQRAAREPFDLTRGELFRVWLLRVSAQRHVVQIVMHHIISDGWSMGLILRELGALYQAYREGRASPLPDLQVQYADYALWQRQWLQGEVLEKQLSYWKEQLAGVPATLDLPTDHPRPPRPSFRGSSRYFSIPREISVELNKLCQRQEVTLYMTLLAVLQIVLSRWSGQNDVTVGCPIAGRNHPRTEGLIGFFLNTLVLRTDLSGDPTFLELLQRVKETTLSAYAHQDLPFERLVAELQPERDLSHQALFQVMLTQSVPLASGPTPLWPGLTLRMFPPELTASKFDLAVEFGESPAGIEGRIEYATDLFELDTIDRFIGAFKRVLEGVVTHADQ